MVAGLLATCAWAARPSDANAKSNRGAAPAREAGPRPAAERSAPAAPRRVEAAASPARRSGPPAASRSESRSVSRPPAVSRSSSRPASGPSVGRSAPSASGPSTRIGAEPRGFVGPRQMSSSSGPPRTLQSAPRPSSSPATAPRGPVGTTVRESAPPRAVSPSSPRIERPSTPITRSPMTLSGPKPITRSPAPARIESSPRSGASAEAPRPVGRVGRSPSETSPPATTFQQTTGQSSAPARPSFAEIRQRTGSPRPRLELPSRETTGPAGAQPPARIERPSGVTPSLPQRHGPVTIPTTASGPASGALPAVTRSPHPAGSPGPAAGAARPSLADIRRRIAETRPAAQGPARHTPSGQPGQGETVRRGTASHVAGPGGPSAPAGDGPKLIDGQGKPLVRGEVRPAEHRGLVGPKQLDARAPEGPARRPTMLVRSEHGGPGSPINRGPGGRGPGVKGPLGGDHGPGVGKHGPGGPKNPMRFDDRHVRGDFNHLTKGPVARELRLDDQYRHHKHGDVARRMALYDGKPRGPHAAIHPRPDHGGPPHRAPHYWRGWVSPHYTSSCFRFWYHGPGYYVSLYAGPTPYYWYPRWSPWVRWSWYFDCGPDWDPRPLYCRPIVYAPCAGWVYWDAPVWSPLPVVASGTWVDVGRVIVEPKRSDLQLLAVRFVDPGHPDEKLGPRYRVWFRNNGDEPIQQPFDVLLLAGNDEQLAAELPRAGVRVASMEPGETQSVDVRLPFEVARMGREAQGEPIPFSTLHVLIDANREIDEISEENNGTRLAAEVVLPVDPAAFELDPKQAATGGEVLLAGEGFGPAPGKVLLHLGGIEMEAEILGWYDLGVRLAMPQLPLAGPTDAELIVVRADGAAANPLAITLTPAERPEPIAPGPVLPE
ncbi:MAG: hypothetical protein JW809_06710 [Pirellulales bacterium]|nr:hypothetical protein [Pirellulales bacterium]